MAYRLKTVRYHNSDRKILLQNENGPCPLLAAANALLLRGVIALPPACIRNGIASLNDVVNVLAEKAMSNPKINNKQQQTTTTTTPEQHNQQQNHYIDELLNLLPTLQDGMDVNPKFTQGVTGYEYTSQLTAFDLLNLELVHGWLIDPQDKEVHDCIAANTYNQLIEFVIHGKEAKEQLEKIQDEIIELQKQKRDKMQQEQKKTEEKEQDATEEKEQEATEEKEQEATKEKEQEATKEKEQEATDVVQKDDPPKEQTEQQPEQQCEEQPEQGLEEANSPQQPSQEEPPEETHPKEEEEQKPEEEQKQEEPAKQEQPAQPEKPVEQEESSKQEEPSEQDKQREAQNTISEQKDDADCAGEQTTTNTSSKTGTSQDSETNNNTKDMSSEESLQELQQKQVDLSKVVLKGSLIDDFLNSSSHQLTHHGLTSLYEHLQGNQLCVFFRNNHFATLTKNADDGLLYLLVTDLGYANVSNVIWEKLDGIDGNTDYVDCDFQKSSALKSAEEELLVGTTLSPEQLLAQRGQAEADYQLALQLSKDGAAAATTTTTSTTTASSNMDEEEGKLMAAATEASLRAYNGISDSAQQPQYTGGTIATIPEGKIEVGVPVEKRKDPPGQAPAQVGAAVEPAPQPDPDLVLAMQLQAADVQEEDASLALARQLQEEENRRGQQIQQQRQLQPQPPRAQAAAPAAAEEKQNCIIS